MASAGIISHLHFSANLFIEPNLNAVGALVKTMFAPFLTDSHF